MGMEVFKVQEPELLQAIEWSKKSFESTIIRGFTNAAVRRSIWRNAPAKQHPIDDVFFSVKEDTHVELTNLNLLREPDFRFTEVQSDFELLYLAAKIDVGRLEIAGDFYANNNALNNLLPVSSSGKVTFVLENVKAQGLIGLYPIEDSFLTNNYALVYEPEKITVTITYQDNEGEVKSEVESNKIDETLVEHYWMDACKVLNKILKMQLDEVIVELSVCELLQGEDELVEGLRTHSKAINVITNDIFDKIIANANNRINEMNASSIPAPDIEASFTKKVATVSTTGRFVAKQGWFRNLATLSRKGNVSVAFESGKLVVYGTVGLTELKVAAKANIRIGYDHYTAKLMDIGPTGTIQTTVGKNAAVFKFVLEKTESGARISLADFKITDISDIEAHVTGLGGLNGLASKISSWMASTLRWKVAPVVEANVKENVNKVLENFDVNSLLKK